MTNVAHEAVTAKAYREAQQAAAAAAAGPRHSDAPSPLNTAGAPSDGVGALPEDPEGVDLAEAAVMAEAEAQTADDAIAVRVQSAITMHSFEPEHLWAAKITTGQPRGFYVSLGRLRGTVTATEDYQAMFGGKILSGIGLKGQFWGLAILRDNAVLQAGTLFLSNVFSSQIKAALATVQRHDPAGAIRIDVDVGVEATGKTVPYAWTITHYMSGKAREAVTALMAPRPNVGTKLIPGQPAAARQAIDD